MCIRDRYADQPDVSDQYSFSVTNAREQMLTLTADKVWQDDGSQAADAKEKRPDISFYLYRTTKYKSADELLSAFDKAIGEQQDLTNIPRETIEMCIRDRTWTALTRTALIWTALTRARNR